MAAVFAVDYPELGNPDATKALGVYIGTITFSGSYTTGGDTLSFAVQNVLGYAAPLRVEIYEEPSSTQTSTGYQFVYAKGSNASNGKIQINASQGTPFSGSYSTTFATTKVKARVWLALNQ
jgi:hypothetical protein